METPSDNIHTNEDVRNNTSTFVIGLQPPPLASAYERVVWREGTTAGTDPSHSYQRLNIVTTRSPTAETDSGDDSMDSGHSSPDLSTQDLLTPIDSPEIPSLSIKDEVDDTHHIVHRERAPHTDHASRSGPSVSESLELSNAVISTTFAPRQPDKPTQSQGYTVSIGVLEDAFDLKSGMTHELLVDTGCDDTFCFGRGVMRVVSEGPKDRHGVSTERVDWDLLKAIKSHMLHTTIQHRFNPRLANEELEARGNIIGQLDFADGSIARELFFNKESVCSSQIIP
ncbi:hypothetical protein EVJ58_g3637 [Rhodofomes roseus]|uniref:Uncharacterized protein n=1 Tax=Rhodofomes roseus TaxID=34475 RepID=A0A4Y9YMS7_9APHY|nr:hypothetical protein EVJ58_g3637 [Rhodofomes roseus]